MANYAMVALRIKQICHLHFFSCPVLGTVFQEQLAKIPEAETAQGVQSGKHHPVLLQAIADDLGLSVSHISDFELCLADHSPAVSTGHSLLFKLLL